MREQVRSIQVENQLKTLVDLTSCLKGSIILRGPSLYFAKESLKQFSLRVFLQEMCTQNVRQFEHQGIEMSCKASLFGDYWGSLSLNHTKMNLKEMQFVLF